MVLLLGLPDESLVLILERLDLHDLYNCSLTCRLLHQTIRESVALQYHIHLLLAGAEDCGEASKITIADRLAELKTRQINWDNLQFRKRATLSMPEDCRVWELCGGVIAYGLRSESSDNTCGLAFHELPSVSRGFIGRHWKHSNFGISIKDFTMDPTQDLVVMVGKPSSNASRDTEEEMIYLFSMISGEVHPLANSGTLTCRFEYNRRDTNQDYIIQIMGDTIGVLFHSRGVECHEQLFIWNWKSGQCLTDYIAHNEKMDSFCFISPRHFVLSKTYPLHWESVKLPQMEVFEFIGPGILSMSPKLVRCFLFPSMVLGNFVTSMVIRSEPPPLHPSQNHKKPFVIAPSSHVVTISMEIFRQGVVGNLESDTFVLFMHRSTLLEDLELPLYDIFVPWRKWGPAKTRILRTDVGEITWVCYVYGSRYIALDPFLEIGAGSHLRMLDFNPWPIRNAQRSHHKNSAKYNPLQSSLILTEMQGSVPAGTICEIIRSSEPTTIAGGTVFSEEITTTLPYRYIRSEERFDYRAVMIEEDCFVGLYRRTNGTNLRSVEVLCL
ncbi:hypothetical protein K439DRAFT_1632000 [Ramaria rubella]|nr:hypothetical protein K439DRAFT_1632000 [Ramaria rubella]